MSIFRSGIIPLSGDPITNGHFFVIQKALEECDRVIVLIAENTTKPQYLFSLDERFMLAEKVIAAQFLQERSRIEVRATNGLLMDAVIETQSDAVYRGVRNDEDKRLEHEQEALNSLIAPDYAVAWRVVETPPELSIVSSSWIKDLARMHVGVTPFVHPRVHAALQERIHGQMIIGVLGPIAAGKSSMTGLLVTALQKRSLEASSISIDDLLHELYHEESAAGEMIRNALIKRFGAEVIHARDGFSKKALRAKLLERAEEAGEQMQQFREDVLWLEELTQPHIDRLIRSELQGRGGVIFIEWGHRLLLPQTPLACNRSLVIEAEDEQRRERNETRASRATLFDLLDTLQPSASEQYRNLQNLVEKDQYGFVEQIHTGQWHGKDSSHINAVADTISNSWQFSDSTGTPQ